MREENIIDLGIFRRICGDEFWHRVVFGMTHAVSCADQIRHQREDELVNKFWKDPLERGAQRAFLHETPESANELLKLLPPCTTGNDEDPEILSVSFMQTIAKWLKRRVRKVLDVMRFRGMIH